MCSPVLGICDCCQGLRQNLRITARDVLEFLVREKATDTDALCFGILFLKKIF